MNVFFAIIVMLVVEEAYSRSIDSEIETAKYLQKKEKGEYSRYIEMAKHSLLLNVCLYSSTNEKDQLSFSKKSKDKTIEFIKWVKNNPKAYSENVHKKIPSFWGGVPWGHSADFIAGWLSRAYMDNYFDDQFKAVKLDKSKIAQRKSKLYTIYGCEMFKD
tara:strand:- start:189 stop:668 length:480 start_codon:yes stop_codon:yes gene_type:complete